MESARTKTAFALCNDLDDNRVLKVPRRNCRTQGGFRPGDSIPKEVSEYVAHPWTVKADRLSQGKQFSCLLLGELLNRHRPLGNLEFAEEFHPLMSQPLMELCLKIPSYLLTRGGRPRALARTASGNIYRVKLSIARTKAERRCS